MKNITISMDDGLAQRTRVAAARAGKSVSKFLADAAKEKIARDDARARDDEVCARLDALKAIWAGPQFPISVDGRMPTADERNARE